MTSMPKVSCLLGAFFLAFFAGRPIQPQSLDDWKTALSAAQSGRGCESIPYPSYRDLCQRKQSLVEDLCKTENWSCRGLETKALRENIKNLSERIQRLKSDKDRLASQRSSAATESEKNELDKKISEVEKEIYEKSKELDYMKRSVETDLSDIDRRLYKGGQCLDARTDVQSAFKSAMGDAYRENDPKIQVIAKQLMDYWTRKAEEHEKAFQDTKQGIENCKRCRDGDL